MPKSPETGGSLPPEESLEEIQGKHDEKQLAEQEAQAVQEGADAKRAQEEADAVEGLELREKLLKIGKMSDLEKKGLELDRPENRLEDVVKLQEKASADLENNADLISEQKEKLAKIQKFIAGKTDVAPEITKMLEEVSNDIESASRAKEHLTAAHDGLTKQFEEISVITNRIDSLGDQVDDIERQFNNIEANPAVKKQLWERAKTENEIINEFREKIKRPLSEYRSNNSERTQEGLEFANLIAGQMLQSEIDRLGIDEIEDAKERQEATQRVAGLISRGVMMAKDHPPSFGERKTGQWELADEGTPEDDQESRFKGYLTASLLNSAAQSAFTIPGAVRMWTESHGGDKEDEERIMSEMLPLLNRVKARADVDSFKPYNREDGKFENSTHVYGSFEYYRDTFDTPITLNEKWKLGDASLEDGLPLVPTEWRGDDSKDPERKAMQVEYNKELKTAEKAVNRVRTDREKARVLAMKEIPGQLKELQAEAEKVQDLDVRTSGILDGYRRQEEGITKAEKVIASLAKRLRAATQNEASKKTAVVSAGFLGKRAAKTALATATQSKGRVELELTDERRGLVTMQKEFEAMEDEYKQVTAKGSDRLWDRKIRVGHSIDNLERELKMYKSASYATPVNLTASLEK